MATLGVDQYIHLRELLSFYSGVFKNLLTSLRKTPFIIPVHIRIALPRVWWGVDTLPG
jgi:hypothetical protein